MSSRLLLLLIALLYETSRIGAQPAAAFFVNETRLFATAARTAPDLVACRLPDDAANATTAGALFPAQSAKTVWLWASLVAYPAYRPVSVQVVGLRSGRVVRAWDLHPFPPGLACIAGSFAIGALRQTFGADQQLLAQLIIDDQLLVSIPFALVQAPAAVARSMVRVVARLTEPLCDWAAPSSSSLMNVTDDSVAVFCVDVDLIDRRRPAPIQIEMRAGDAVLSAYRNDGADLGASTVLFMPVPIRHLRRLGPGPAAFAAEFRYGGRLLARQNFTLAPAGPEAIRFCAGADAGNCSAPVVPSPAPIPTTPSPTPIPMTPAATPTPIPK